MGSRPGPGTRSPYNGLGRDGQAVAALRRQAVDPSYRDSSPRPIAELIGAAARSGDSELAGLAHERLAETTRGAGTDWALGIEARSRALLADGDAADALYREAIERLGRTSIRLQLARAHLGTRMFVSQTTVACHLRNVFSKLNIASRHQLATVLSDSANA
jgi:Bacterial regulatory proteins, luxR family